MPATLASLRVKNFALVEELAWQPGPGFNAITGETGAGKSILIGALKLLLGERADRSQIRAGAEQCAVEAVFEIPGDTAAWDAFLEERGAEPCQEGQLILRRVIAVSGQGRQFVNGSPCPLSLLRDIGDRLVDLHGPHDHQSLFHRERQTALLDDYARLSGLVCEFAEARRGLLSLIREQEEALQGQRERAREADLLSHQIAEIEAAALRPDEEESLASRHRAASNAQRISQTASAALEALSEGQPCLLSLSGDLGRLLRDIARLDDSAASLASLHAAAHEQLAELHRELTRYLDRIELDPAKLAEIEARLDLIVSLKRKYGSTIPEILTFAEGARVRLSHLEALEGRKASLADEISAATARVADLAARITAARKKASEQLAADVAAQLRELGFKQPGFSIRLEPQEGPPAFAPLGAEVAEFVFAPNPGEPPQPLRQIASSGEISRVMLALKSALAAQDSVGLLVFDEIDANVGGETAVRVGRKMAALAASHQVLCITHLPQVAAAASHHFKVAKEEESGRTVSRIQPLDPTAREQELARMLGGTTGAALAHARELLAVQREQKTG